MKNFKKQLQEIDACLEAVEWVEWVEDRTLEQAWGECHRGDWMLWLAQKRGVDHRKLTLAKAKCARLVIHLMKDERSRNAVEVAERYGNNEATREELDTAADAAADAYVDVAAYAYTAYAAAACTAYATCAADASKKEILQKCADICREVLTDEILTEKLEGRL
jgi:hypothetical protein